VPRIPSTLVIIWTCDPDDILPRRRPGAVPADDLDARVLAQPGLEGVGNALSGSTSTRLRVSASIRIVA
jgi:hypothetical protein